MALLGAWIAEWSSHSTYKSCCAAPCPGPCGRSVETIILFCLKHNIYTQLSEKTDQRKQNKQLIILLIVKKLLKFVFFMKVC